MSTTYRFKGRATGADPTGYYHPRWDKAVPISVLAATQPDATRKALELLGTHARFGNHVYYGWALIWDSIEEEQPTPTRKEAS